MADSRHVVALGVCAVFLGSRFDALQNRAPAGGPSQAAIIAGDPAPAPEQIRALIARAVQNQHANDQALQEFERVEHIVIRKAEKADVLSDKTLRIVPFGTDTLKLPMAENGIPDTPAEYRKQLEYAAGILERTTQESDPYRPDVLKHEKRQRERSELVDTAAKAFRMTWAGRETRNGQTLIKLLLEPDPNFKPPTRLAVIFQHVHATLWVDESQAQVARIEGDIASDVYFGGGIAGKITQGGHFTLEQQEAAPNVWLPTLRTYDVDGRRFMFPFGVHERSEISRYRRIGPPAQALQAIRSELNNQASATPVP